MDWIQGFDVLSGQALAKEPRIVGQEIIVLAAPAAPAGELDSEFNPVPKRNDAMDVALAIAILIPGIPPFP